VTARETRLLGLLGWTALVCACALIAAAGFERLREVDASLARYRDQKARLEARAAEDPAALEARVRELSDLVRSLEARRSPAGPGTGDPAAFGAEVRRRLRESGMTVLRYQPGSPGSGDLEFAAQGTSLAFADFLRTAAASGWEIPFLSVRSERASAPVELTLRIRHGD